jgi:hypothetical protein
MFPNPPQLLDNLFHTELWQVTMLVPHTEKLPAAVQATPGH